MIQECEHVEKLETLSWKSTHFTLKNTLKMCLQYTMAKSATRRA